MSFGGYETATVLSGLCLLGTSALTTEEKPKERLWGAGIGAGMIVYAFFVSLHTSGTWIFPIQLIALGFLAPLVPIAKWWLAQQQPGQDAPAQVGPTLPGLVGDRAARSHSAPVPWVPGRRSSAPHMPLPAAPAAAPAAVASAAAESRASAPPITRVAPAAQAAPAPALAAPAALACRTVGCEREGTPTAFKFCGSCGQRNDVAVAVPAQRACPTPSCVRSGQPTEHRFCGSCGQPTVAP